MLAVLGMEFETIRTVLKNSVNEITVCTGFDIPGIEYTVIALYEKQLAKHIAGEISTNMLFADNDDFVGSFVRTDIFYLVFKYNHESLLAGKENIYAPTFSSKKEISQSLLAAIAATSFPPDMAALLINKQCINISKNGGVYLNYFMDFSDYKQGINSEIFLRHAVLYCFGILSGEYREKYENIELYPYELKLLYKKNLHSNFKSYSQAIAFIKNLPEELTQQRIGILLFWDRILLAWGFVRRHSATFVLAAVVCITLVFLFQQLYLRGVFRRDPMGVRYTGMDHIGEMYLGEEDI